MLSVLSSLILPDLVLDNPGDLLNLVFFGIIITFSCLGLGILALSWFKERSTLTRFLALFKNETVDTVANNRLSLSESFSKNRILRKYCSVWHAFDHNLLRSQASDEEAPKLFNPSYADLIFNRDTLNIRTGQGRFVAALPGILTGLGVLGTFIGLLYGLTSLGNIDLRSDNFSQLSNGIFDMIAGASVAFKTSVWGVVASLGINIVEKWAYNSISSKLRLLQNCIDQLYPHIDAETILEKVERSTSNTSQVMSTLAEQIGAKLQASMQDISQNIVKALENTLRSLLVPTLKEISKNASQQANSAAEASVASMEKVIEKFMGEISGAANQQQQLIQNTNQSLGETVNHLVSEVKQHEDATQTQVSNLMEQQSGFVSQLTNTLAAQDAQNKSAYENTIASLANSRQAFDDQMQALTLKLNEMIDNVQQTTHQSVASTQTSQQAITQSIETNIQRQEEINGKLAEDLAKVSEQFDRFSSSIPNLNQGLVQAAGHLENAASNVTSVSTTFATSAQTMVQEVNKAAEQVKLAGVENNHAIQSIQTIQQTLADTIARLKELMSDMDTTVQNYAAASDKSRDLFSTLSAEFDQVLSSIRQQLAQLNKDIAGTMQEHISLVGAQTQKGLDKFMGDISGAAAQQQRLIENTNQSLDATVRQLVNEVKEHEATAQDQVSSLMKQQADFVTHLTNTLATQDSQNKVVYENTIASLANNSQAFDRQMKDLTLEMSSMIESIQKTARKSAADTQTSQQAIAQSIESNIEQQKASNDKFTEDLANVSERLDRFGKSVAELNLGLERATGNLEKATANVTSVGTAFANSATTMAQEVNQAAQQVKIAGDENASTIRNFQKIQQELSDTINRMKELMSAMDDTVQNYSDASDKSKEVFDSISTEFDRVLDSIKKQLDQLNQDIAQTMQRYINLVNEQTNDRMSVWNRDTSEFTKSMTEATKTIADIVDQLDSRRK